MIALGLWFCSTKALNINTFYLAILVVSFALLKIIFKNYICFQVAMQLRDEHNAVSIVFVDDGKEDSLLDSEKTLLGVYLDLSPGARMALRDSADDDSVVENKERSALKLYKCSDEGGTYKVVEVKTGPLMQEDLNTNVSFQHLLDWLRVRITG